MLTCLQPEFLEKFQQRGEILVIWCCEKCQIKKPFYKSGNDFIDGIYLMWAKDHKLCDKCSNPHKKIILKKNRISNLLEEYEIKEEEEWNYDIREN